MSELHPEGFYEGKVSSAWVETSDDGGLVMCFECALDDLQAEVTCKHITSGQWGHLGQAVAEKLDLDWPGGLKKIEAAVGRSVTVKIKNKVKGDREYQNCYIMANDGGGGVKATAEQIEAGIAKIEADECPI